jgi:hypothetical protein
MSDDPKISERYRELPREEPPRALDERILAASRRAVQRRRLYVPLAAAAVITLAAGVTLHMQHDRPGEEVDAVSPSMKVQEVPKAEAPRQDRFTPDPKPQAAPAPAREPAASEADVQRAPAPQASSPAPAAGARASRDQQSARSRVSSASIERSPDVELERIARLRAAARHEEADRLLAEFRKRYPDFRLSDEMKAKVERRQ